MIRVLFVDDDPEVLDHLRQLLHRQEREWDMVFAPDPDSGLAELAREPADVVVSDLRMPGMGGAGFLARVRDLYPGAARIVLSGDAEGEVAGQALPFAHQYLGKPCRTDQLVDAVNRTGGLYAHLDDPALRGIIAGLDRLPTVPIPHDAVLYRQRHKIEIMFGRLKDWRRIHTRYDRCAHTFMSAIAIAAVVIFWL